jgi:hypothetical protein
MFRLPVSDADCCWPPRPAGASASPVRSPSRSGVFDSVVIVLPAASHNSCTEPKLDTGTRYENGSTMSVTRRYCPSGETSTVRIIAGSPSLRPFSL